jgi:tight adherence protein C
LFEQAKEGTGKVIKDPGTLSAKESLAFFFKVQNMFGELGEKVRDQMLQAGIRDPKAPLIYLMARAIIPTVLVLFTWLVMAKGDREFEPKEIFFAVVAMALPGFSFRASWSKTIL